MHDLFSVKLKCTRAVQRENTERSGQNKQKQERNKQTNERENEKRKKGKKE